MKLVVTERVNINTVVQERSTAVVVRPFGASARKLLEVKDCTTTTADDDITLVDGDKPIQFIDPNGGDRVVHLPPTGINNHGFIIINIADDEEYLKVFTGTTKIGEIDPHSGIGWFVSNGLEWINAGGASGGGGAGATYQMLTNRSGDAVDAGDVMIVDIDHEKSVMRTNIENDLRVIGVANAPINNNTEGRVDTLAGVITTVNCTSAAVAVGEYLISSSTEGQAKSIGHFRTPASFAVALTAKLSGSAGTVEAMLLQNIRQTIGGGFGWSFGGYDGAVTTNTQRFTFASETWATVASAALPVALNGQGGIGESTISAYSLSGSTTNASSGGVVNAYKMPYSTEITAAQGSADLPAARYRTSYGCNATYKGYAAGGKDTGGTVRQHVYLLTFATSSTATTNSLSSARTSQRGQSDGNYIYVSGGTAVTCDKITVATDTIGAHTDGNLGTFANGYNSLSFPAVAGYMAYKSGTNNYSRKLPYATGVSANLGNTLSQDQINAAAVSNGLNLGYISGNNATPYTQSSKFELATETYSNHGASALAIGKYVSAPVSYGAF